MKHLFTSAFAALVFAGCSTYERPLVYESELDRAPRSHRLEPQDIRRTVEKMTESLIADEGVIEATGGKRPVLDIMPMKNRSYDTNVNLNMATITDSVRMRLIRSRLFRFVDRSTQGADITLMDEQAQLGLTDQRKAIKPGKQLAAQMYLTGTLYEMRNQVDDQTDRYYKFSMILKDISSGEIIWSDEQEIRKVANKSMF